MNININILQPTINVVASLHPYLAVLKAIWDAYSQVSDNRSQARSVAERASSVLGAISDELSKHPDGVKEEEGMKRAFYALDEHFRHIRDMMRKLSKMNFLKILLRQDDIKRQLEDAHVRLSDCLQVFQISTQLSLRAYQHEYEVARQSDASLLAKKLVELEGNDGAMLEALQIGRGEMMEAMVAMQKSLHDSLTHSIESRILTHALQTLQRTSGRSFSGPPPPWVISAYNIDIDDDGPALGEGGFGSVRRARWGGLDVAVKVMLQGTSQEALLREVQIWQHLRHDHVLPFYGACVTANPPFIVSRLLTNGNALQYLRKHLAANRVKIMHEVALGMTYLHHSNIIHGDLKGVNILMDDSGKAVVCDFGLSKVKQHALSRAPSSLASQQASAGTLRFMSPEQMMGVLGKPADVYGYAMLMYEIFTGDVPFYTLPDATFFVLVAQQHTRLTRPTAQKVITRGLGDEMWALLWDCSEPEAEYRPTFDGVRMRTEQVLRWFEPAKEGEEAVDEEEITDLFAAMYGEETTANGAMTRTEMETTAYLPYVTRADIRPAVPIVANPKQVRYVPLAPKPVVQEDEGTARWRQAELVRKIRALLATQERWWEASMNKGRERKPDDVYWRNTYRETLTPYFRKPFGIVEKVREALGKDPERIIYTTIVPFWASPLTDWWPDAEVALFASCWDTVFQKLPGSGYDTLSCYRASDPALAVGSFDMSWISFWMCSEGCDSLELHANLLRSGGLMVADVVNNSENWSGMREQVENHPAFRDVKLFERHVIAVRR